MAIFFAAAHAVGGVVSHQILGARAVLNDGHLFGASLIQHVQRAANQA
jgi:hypothetical protein